MKRKTTTRRQRAPKATQAEMDSRKRFFWELLYGQAGANVGEAVPLDEFHKKANGMPGQSQIALRTCERTLQEMRRERSPYSGTVLKVGKHQAWLERVAARVVEERLEQRTPIKSRLGRLLLNIIFRLEFDDVESELIGTELGIAELRRKLDALRKKSPLHLFIDAGSTMIKFCEELLKLDAIPVAVPTGHNGSSGGYRYVSPHVTTNCPKIAVMIGDSNHSADIGVTVIGGDQRSERGSICGSLSSMWLSQINPVADIAIVGATGYQQDHMGRPAFGSDNHEEAELKASFLSRAWLRIIVLDSSKFVVPPVSRIFCGLSRENVDLIVCDDGESNWHYQTAFEETFRRDVAKCDVVAQALKTRPGPTDAV